MAEKVAEISNPAHKADLMNSLKNFVNSDTFTDVLLISQEGRKVLVHKLMLVGVSRLMKEILLDHPVTSDMTTIYLPDVSYKMLRLVVNFLYIGYMRLNEVEMEDFKSVMDLLGIELLQKSNSSVNEYQLVPSDPGSSGSSNKAPQSVEPMTNQDMYYNRNNPCEVRAIAPTNFVNSVPVAMANYGQVQQTQMQAVTGLGNGGQYVTVQLDSHNDNTTNLVGSPYPAGGRLLLANNVMMPINDTRQPLPQASSSQYTTYTTVMSSPATSNSRQPIMNSSTNILPISSSPNIHNSLPAQSPGSLGHQSVQGSTLHLMRTQVTPTSQSQSQMINTAQRPAQHTPNTAKRNIIIDLSADEDRASGYSQQNLVGRRYDPTNPGQPKRIRSSRLTISKEIIDLDGDDSSKT